MADSASLKTLAWRLIVQTEGVEKNTRNAANSLARFGQGISRLNTLMRASAATYLVQQYFKVADAYTTLQNKLRLVTTNQAELNTIQKEVVDIAQRTRTDVTSTADLYTRAARSLDGYGLSQREVLKFTEAVSQAIQVSGATAKEASQGVIQFSQGLASGKLAGDELRAVLEQMPRLGRAIAEGMGVGYGELRKLGAEGKLTTARILDALRKTAPGIAAEFEKMLPTVESGFTVVTNGLSILIGEFDRGLGLSAAFARGLKEMGLAMTDMAPKARNVAIDIQEFLTVATVGFLEFFETMGPKFRKWRAESTMRGAQINPSMGKMVDQAQKELAEANAELAAYETKINSEFDAIRANFTDLRRDLNTANADLDKAGNNKGGLSPEEIKRREEQAAGLAKILADLAAAYRQGEVDQKALTIAMAEGEEASKRFSAAEAIRLSTQTKLSDLSKKTGPLEDEDALTDIGLLTEDLVNQSAELMTTGEAWSIFNKEIDAGKDSFERTAEEIDLLNKAMLALGGELSGKQKGQFTKRIRVLMGELTDVAKLTGEVFATGINGLTNFLMEGAKDVRGFVRGMIQEIGKLVVQMLILRAVKGTGMEKFFSEKGNVFHGGAPIPFAHGGLVGGPTAFAMGGGRTGIMGEAGPEAIMPLARLPSGDLGVRANPAKIEVINKTGVNASARIQQSADRTSIILEAAELGASLAEQRMTRSMRNGYGATASTMQRTYALKRQG